MTTRASGSPVQGSLWLFWGVLLGTMVPTWCLSAVGVLPFWVFVAVCFVAPSGLIWYMIVIPVKRAIREEEEADRAAAGRVAMEPERGTEARQAVSGDGAALGG